MNRTIISTLMLAVTCLAAGGCFSRPVPGGLLAVQSHLQPEHFITGDFDHVTYRYIDRNNLTVILREGPEDKPTQMVRLDVFYRPRPGKNPIAPTATNATVQVHLFPEGQMGIYRGAGFAFAPQRAGGRTVKLRIWDATLLLTDQTEGFHDPLGAAILRGEIIARRDDQATLEVTRELDRLVAQTLEASKNR